MNIQTDEQLDQMLAFRLSRETPLPAEISLNGSPKTFFDRVRFFDVWDLRGSAVVSNIVQSFIDESMAAAMERASHLDRVAHFVAATEEERGKTPAFDMRNIQNPDAGKPPSPPAGGGRP